MTFQDLFDPAELRFDPDRLRAKYREERDKRLRPDGNEQYQEVVGDFSRYVDDPYVEPGYTRAPVSDEIEAAVIGGGFGGLLAAARLREAGVENLRVIEKGGDFGGTWYWNRYPGRDVRHRGLHLPASPRGDRLRTDREIRARARDPGVRAAHRGALPAV